MAWPDSYIKLKLYIKAKRNVEQRKHLKIQVFWDATNRQGQHRGEVILYIDPCYSLKSRKEIFVTEFERFNSSFLGHHLGYISDLFHTP
jgi:hypothetical protein